MKQLELKHLLPYLCHKLEAIEKGLRYANIEEEYRVFVIGATSMNEEYPTVDTIINGITETTDLSRIKPILRPLSDLTKDKDVYNKLDLEIILVESGDMNAEDLSYKSYIWLIENHYDYFGLITEGLAIDINTIK